MLSVFLRFIGSTVNSLTKFNSWNLAQQQDRSHSSSWSSNCIQSVDSVQSSLCTCLLSHNWFSTILHSPLLPLFSSIHSLPLSAANYCQPPKFKCTLYPVIQPSLARRCAAPTCSPPSIPSRSFYPWRHLNLKGKFLLGNHLIRQAPSLIDVLPAWDPVPTITSVHNKTLSHFKCLPLFIILLVYILVELLVRTIKREATVDGCLLNPQKMIKKNTGSDCEASCC